VVDRLAKDLLREPLRVNISSIETIDAGFQAYIDEAGRFGDIGLAPCPEKLTPTAKGAGAKT
jgi:hypothetical protein